MPTTYSDLEDLLDGYESAFQLPSGFDFQGFVDAVGSAVGYLALTWLRAQIRDLYASEQEIDELN